MLDELVQVSVSLRLEKSQKCLQAAQILLASESFADAANRSYYCIFHAMQAVLITSGFSAKTHSSSITEFRKSFIRTGLFPQHYSDFIGDAFTVLSKSDYDIFYVIKKAEVAQQIENAKEFLSAVEAYIEKVTTEETVPNVADNFRNSSGEN